MWRDLYEAVLESFFDGYVFVFEEDGFGFCLGDLLAEVDYFLLEELDEIFFALPMFAGFLLDWDR